MLRTRDLERTDGRKDGWTDKQTDHLRSPAERGLNNSTENDPSLSKYAGNVRQMVNDK